jgi:GT2 family glycosyltransferase
MRSISVIVVARDEGRELRLTVENLEDTLPESAEIVVIDDGSRDGSGAFLARRRGRVRLERTAGLGVARARNRGAACARGDLLIFADAHIRVEKDWWKPLVELAEKPRVGAAAPGVRGIRRHQEVGYGLTFRGPELTVRWLAKAGSAPFPALILPGCCLAMRRAVFESAGGWDCGLHGVGGNDNEFCLRLWLLGWRLLIAPEVVVRHRFRQESKVPVHGAQYVHNHLRLALVHLKPERVGRVFAAFQEDRSMGMAVALLVAGDAMERRMDLLARRIKNDDWCFKQFGLEW